MTQPAVRSKVTLLQEFEEVLEFSSVSGVSELDGSLDSSSGTGKAVVFEWNLSHDMNNQTLPEINKIN